MRNGIGLALAVLALAGCGGEGPKTHAVRGTVATSNGTAPALTGHLVEIALVSDPTVRASGVIEADGRFQLETLDSGKRYGGAKEGAYQARIVIVDEGDGQTQKPRIAKRYLDFKTSGWSVHVPNSGDVTLTVSGK